MLGWRLNKQIGRISLPTATIVALFDTLGEWPEVRVAASAKEIVSLTGTLWNTTFIFHAWKKIV